MESNLQNISEEDLRKKIHQAIEELSQNNSKLTNIDKQLDTCTANNKELKRRGLVTEPLKAQPLMHT